MFTSGNVAFDLGEKIKLESFAFAPPVSVEFIEVAQIPSALEFTVYALAKEMVIRFYRKGFWVSFAQKLRLNPPPKTQ